MVYLRSRRETGDDAKFSLIPEFLVPPLAHVYHMRVLPCRVFRAAHEKLYSPFLGFVSCTMGFVGEGSTLSAVADDTCRKLVTYIEHRVAGGWPPLHRELREQEAECWSAHRQTFGEWDFQENEGKGEMQFGSPTDFMVFAELLEGIVSQVGWKEEGSSSWFVWKMPGFSSLD